MIWFNLLAVVVVGYAAWTGYRRGGALIALEIASLALATALAFWLYREPGAWLRAHWGVTTGLANLSSLVALWLVGEVAAALVIRWLILPRLPKAWLHLSRVARGSGAGLNAAKVIGLVGLLVAVAQAVPLSTPGRAVIAPSATALAIAPVARWWRPVAASGLSRDVADSLATATVPDGPGDHKLVQLGFTAVGRVDAAAEADLLSRLNAERTSRHLPALTLNRQARLVGRAYAAQMLAGGYFGHIEPSGRTPFDRLRAGGVAFGAAGENLALAPTVAAAHTGLMNSAGHRANILAPGYRQVGIGIIDAGPNGFMVAQEFTD